MNNNASIHKQGLMEVYTRLKAQFSYYLRFLVTFFVSNFHN